MTRKITGLQPDLVDAVGSLIVQARSALFITGAGMSAESGLSVYRGIAGLVRRQPDDGKKIEAALAAELFARKPAVTWPYLLEMDENIRAARPTRGHEVLVELERELPRSSIMTVNIDRLHQRAGSRNVIEMHGALHDLLCVRCEISTRTTSFATLAEIPPRCRACGGTLRPDMPLFGESLPQDPMTRLQLELEQGFDLVIAIGVSIMLPYLARPLLLAKSEGIPTVEIGTAQTDVSGIVDFRFKGAPSRVLDLIADVVKQLRTRPGSM